MTDNENTTEIINKAPETLEELIKYQLENNREIRRERCLFHCISGIVARTTGHDLEYALSTLDKLELLHDIIIYRQSIDPDFNSEFSGNIFDLLN